MSIVNIILIIVIILYPGCFADPNNDKDLFLVNVTMKDYQSIKDDELIFVQYKLPDEELTIVGYTPLAATPTVHHMNTFACENPYSQEAFWLDTQPCGPGAQMFLHGWDRDALPFRFPQDVGVLVGKNTPYKYIIVDVHYLFIVKNDYSGNQLIMSRKRRKYLAGVFVGGLNEILLPPRSQSIKTPFSCQYNGTKISIVAAGVHAHRWARVNSMYRVRNGKLTLIIKGDPQQIHQSYLLSNPIDIVDGDFLIGQCVYDNDQDTVITVGPKHNNEVCNVMAGYAYESNNNTYESVPLKFCWGNNFAHLIPLIPPDSEIPPKKSSYVDTMKMSTDIPIHINRTRIDLLKKIFGISLIIVVIFVIVFLLIFINKRFNCITTLCGLSCLNKFVDKKTHGEANQRSISSGWLNRDSGFERLKQTSDDENEI